MTSIQKRPNGKWRARYRDADGKEHARHFDRKLDARRWLDEVGASMVIGRYVDPRAGAVTLRDFYLEWAQRQVWAPGTRRHMDMVVRGVPFAGSPLRAIRRSHIELWVKDMVDRGMAPQTTQNRLRSLRTVFRAAVNDRVIVEDPTVMVRTPRIARKEERLVIPCPAQVAQILSASGGEMRAYVCLCALAGLRLGEASALRGSDIDFLRRTIQVQRQVQPRPGRGLEVREPKYGSTRTVYAPDQLLEELAQHMKRYGRHPDDYLFQVSPGSPISPTTVDSRWRRIVQRAGLSGLHLHSLRHFFASGLIAQGCDVVTVQRALGHSRPSTTLDTYSHLWPNAEDRTRAAAATMAAEVFADDVADSRRTGDQPLGC